MPTLSTLSVLCALILGCTAFVSSIFTGNKNEEAYRQRTMQMFFAIVLILGQIANALLRMEK